MHKRKLSILMALMLFSACAGKQSVNTQPKPTTDPMREIAFQANRAKDSLQAVTDVKQALYKEQIITQQQSQALTNGLLSTIRILQRINSAAAKYNQFSEGKAELVSLLSELQPAFDTLTKQLLPSFDPGARDRIGSVLSIAASAVAALVPLIKGVL
jgi:hypothetical protein